MMLQPDVEFTVCVQRTTGANPWRVTIHDAPDRDEFASLVAPDLEVALKMAVPYLVAVASDRVPA